MPDTNLLLKLGYKLNAEQEWEKTYKGIKLIITVDWEDVSPYIKLDEAHIIINDAEAITDITIAYNRLLSDTRKFMGLPDIRISSC